jgi:hypothetical protein
MRTLRALTVLSSLVFLSGCGGMTRPGAALPGGGDAPPDANGAASASREASDSHSHAALRCPGQRSFRYTHRAETFTVPKCATSIYVDAMGAAGGGCCGVGGSGGEVSATLPVTPSEKLLITVGGAGSRWHGGFNGGGVGVKSRKYEPGGGGGGASDVRQGGNTLADRVMVAGGGGGEVGGFASGEAVAGGTGGGLPQGGSGGTPYCNIPPSAIPVAGGGGTQSSGGTGGAGSNGGSLGNGGVGVSSCGVFIYGPGPSYESSGGGGGYYGGGGGGNGGSGGGGSGYAAPAATNVSSQNGVNSGNGTILICWGYSGGKCGTDRSGAK